MVIIFTLQIAVQILQFQDFKSNISDISIHEGTNGCAKANISPRSSRLKYLLPGCCHGTPTWCGYDSQFTGFPAWIHLEKKCKYLKIGGICMMQRKLNDMQRQYLITHTENMSCMFLFIQYVYTLQDCSCVHYHQMSL